MQTRTEEYPSSDTWQISERISEMMRDIDSRPEWHEEVSRGKMFGLLIYCDKDGNEGMLKAYSGQICGRSDWPGYVPAVFDYLQPDGYFKQEEAAIVRLHDAGRPTRERSQALQRWLFTQTVLTGADGGRRSVLEVFTDWAQASHSKQLLPPGGTGECCAPKLLHYANSHQLKVLALTEFWYGASPKGEIRHHGRRYEPCQAKCMPILPFLVEKEQLEEMLDSYGNHSRSLSAEKYEGPLTVLYEDPYLIAIDKPAGLLSVPGKRDSYCAETMLREQTGAPFLKAVHRLDMDTSGVLLFAKTEEVYREMQRMFALHEEVEKEYVAKLSAQGVTGEVLTLRRTAGHGGKGGEGGEDEGAGHGGQEHGGQALSGVISIPLAPDFLNRPRQRVDYEGGKEAVTRYVMVGDTVHLFPQTGRTHQLRIHCAHPDGLGRPILGDPLYGDTQADRMYLHACRISFRHPITHENITITSEASF